MKKFLGLYHYLTENGVAEKHEIVLLLAGGYAPTLRQTVEAHSILFKTAKEISAPLFH